MLISNQTYPTYQAKILIARGKEKAHITYLKLVDKLAESIKWQANMKIHNRLQSKITESLVSSTYGAHGLNTTKVV